MIKKLTIATLLIALLLPQSARASGIGVRCAVTSADWIEVTYYLLPGNTVRHISNYSNEWLVNNLLLLTGDLITFNYPPDAPDYYGITDGRQSFNDGYESYPYLIEYWHNGATQSDVQVLVRSHPNQPDLAFLFVYTDYFYQLDHSKTGEHPVEDCSFTMRRAALDELIGLLP